MTPTRAIELLQDTQQVLAKLKGEITLCTVRADWLDSESPVRIHIPMEHDFAAQDFDMYVRAERQDEGALYPYVHEGVFQGYENIVCFCVSVMDTLPVPQVGAEG